MLQADQLELLNRLVADGATIHTAPVAELEQTRSASNAIIIAVVAGFILFTLTSGRNGGNGNGGNGEGGSVMNLAITLEQPIDKKPLEGAGLTRVVFDYKGPAQRLVPAWGIKPDAGFFTRFNNGDNLIHRPFQAWGHTSVNVPALNVFTRQSFSFSPRSASAVIPDPDVTQTNRAGSTVGMNFGNADVWFWITSQNLMNADTGGGEKIVKERNILGGVQNAADVFNILRPVTVVTPDVRNATFTFANSLFKLGL